MNFEKCLSLLLEHEGGYSNLKNDNGGMTNLGITARVWEEWVGHPVDEKQMRALTPETIAPLYRKKYWDAIRADELSNGLDYCVFDCAVNSGVGRAVKILQSCVGVNPDGGFGSVTMAAVSQFKHTALLNLIAEYCDNRLKFLKSLPTWDDFGKGWERRVREVKAAALGMDTP
jgi:lysozyme family protein